MSFPQIAIHLKKQGSTRQNQSVLLDDPSQSPTPGAHRPQGLNSREGPGRRQSRLAAEADKADTDMQHFMNEALADLDGWME